MNVNVIKRDGVTRQPWDPCKVSNAVIRAAADAGQQMSADGLEMLVAAVEFQVGGADLPAGGGTDVPVETVSDVVERELMAAGYYSVAKAYILYRDERRRAREAARGPDVFAARTAFLPFEYPEVEAFKTAIQHSYWLFSEWNFQGDVQDFHIRMTAAEREATRRAVLAISQIEVKVKRFWGDLGKRFPKPEVDQVGAVFAESEVRHSDAYSHLLKVLNLKADFDQLLAVPAIRARVEYLAAGLRGGASAANRDYLATLAMFTMFVENVSLFSQFAIVKSLNKHRNLLKDVDNVIQATAKEEQVHALFGAWLVKQVRAEHPEWFTPALRDRLTDAARDAVLAEYQIIDWIFEAGDLPYCPREQLKAYVCHRMNLSFTMMGFEGVFDVQPAEYEAFDWFEEELDVDVHPDFFHKRPTGYSKKTKPITASSIFDN